MPEQPCPIESPDSLAYAHGRPAITAQLKQRFSDFRVDEQLAFEPSGQGEHRFLRVRKVDLSTTDVARHLAEASGAALSSIGYSGMKDRRGECRQWFSMPAGCPEQGLAALESEGIAIDSSSLNERKLQIGSHKANQFEIVLRRCTGEQRQFEQRLVLIARIGVPNYFGKQRFGRDLSNLHQVRQLMTQALAGGGDARRIGRRRRGMLLSAARAYLFNLLLSERVEAASWDRYEVGDVMNLDDTDSCFAVAEGDWDTALQERLAQADIHPTGPLAGETNAGDRYAPWGKAADIEESILEKYPTLCDGLRYFEVKAARRPLRLVPRDLDWEWESPDVLRLRFQLRRGAYATSLLRELCICEENSE